MLSNKKKWRCYFLFDYIFFSLNDNVFVSLWFLLEAIRWGESHLWLVEINLYWHSNCPWSFISMTSQIYIYIYIYIYIRVGWFFTFFYIKKNNALKVVYIPIKYSYQKLDLNLQRFFANLAWKILNKHVLKSPRFCQIWPKYWCKNQTISVFKLGNLILFYGNIINKL